jgi:hypothetical protein
LHRISGYFIPGPGLAASVSTPKQPTVVDTAESLLALLCKIAQD